MKAKLFTAIAAAAAIALTPSALLTAVNAADEAPPEPIKISGDVNLDGAFNISDMVVLQRYLGGSAEIKEAGFYTADMNNDRSVDIFDMCIMRKEIEKNCKGITKKIDILSGQNGFSQKSAENPNAVITSTYELEEYFQPTYVMTTDGKCYTLEVATQEEIDRYLELYNDEFFEDNVLCLRAITQGSGGIEYKFDSVFYEGTTLKIQYHEVYTADFPINVAIARLAQAVIPKELYMADSVVWEQTESEWLFEPEIRTDITNAANSAAWKAAMSESAPQVIASPEQLESWLDGKFKSAVERSLKNTYNSDFFEENILILDLYAQRYHDDWIMTVSAKKTANASIELCYDREFINGFTDEGIIITQVSVPREQYYGETVTRTMTWAAPIDITYSEFDIGQYEEAMGTQLTTSFSKAGAWINSNEELDEYLSDCLTAEGAELLKNNFFQKDLEEYSAYIWLNSDIIGSTHRYMTAYRGENTISVTLDNYQPLSCYGGAFLHVIYTDKEYSGDNVSLRTFNSNEDNLKYDGELIRFTIGENGRNTIFVNQYTFGDESSADIYLAYPGGGPAEFSSFELIGSLELAKDYFPFSGDQISTFDENGNITYSGNDFTITEIENGVVIIKYRPSAAAEMTEIEIRF